MQAIPSPNYYQDTDGKNFAMKFGLEWQVIPLSYSFHANKYVSKIQSFYINPVKRFSGSVELFFQPVYITGNYKYSDLQKFSFKTGLRTVIPIAQRGEYLAFSLGGGIYYQKHNSGETKIGPSLETAVYSFFGFLGVKFNYNFNAPSKYNIGLYFKYY
jgi:hypothetical protein